MVTRIVLDSLMGPYLGDAMVQMSYLEFLKGSRSLL
jgi:hypothetical protein